MLENKIIIVIGGSGLIGTVFLKAIIAEGGVAINADLNTNVDITQKKSIENLINNIHQQYHKIDAMVCAAYPKNKNFNRDFFDVDYQDFCENYCLHAGGYFLVNQLFSQYFKNQGHGNIINIASIYGSMIPRFELYEDTHMVSGIEYAMIKSAILQLTRYLAKYLRHFNIRVNAISPGGISDHQPEIFVKRYRQHCHSKGLLEPDDLCGTLIYLLSDASKMVHGQNIIVDDGFAL